MFIRLSAVIATACLLSSAAFAQAAKPTDPQIAHIAYTAGVIDINAAKQALTKASNKEVKAFAQDMVRDHEAVNKQALDLVKKLKVTPEDNDTSKTLSKQAADKLAELAKLKGADYDKAYVANEVAYHKAVNKQALDLVKKLKVTPEDNDTSKTLSKQAADKLAELNKLKGAEYDKAYVANEVAYHKAVNSALETQLIPSASNAELKSLLQTGLKIFQGHQQHAEQVAAGLK